MVVNKLNRDLFWRAVELLTDTKRDEPTRTSLAEARPGRTGQVPFGQQRAQTCNGDELLAGERDQMSAAAFFSEAPRSSRIN